MKLLLETLQAGTGYLEKRGVDEARLNMEHLLAHVLGCRRLDLYLRYSEGLQEEDLVRLRGLLRRRGEGEPLQHLLGTVDFLGNELVSDHRALVPRPETEFLVDWLIKERTAGRLPAMDGASTRLLDKGTGSGCIGLTLAEAWRGRGTEAVLADVSEDALDLARLNGSRLHLENVQFLRSDLFDRITGEFNLMVANLPYIPSADIPGLSREVRRDPVLALDGGDDGLDLVRRFLQAAPAFLIPQGFVALEVGDDQGEATAAYATELGYLQARTLRDLAGIDRFVLMEAPLRQEPMADDKNL